MAHKLTLDGTVIRTRKTKGGSKVVVIQDNHSYLTVVAPDRGYIKGQHISVAGRIIEIERGSGYIRLQVDE